MHRIFAALSFAVIALAAAPLAFAADAPTDPRMVEHALGNPKAPVRIDEYYSLDCSHCAAFDTETLPQLKSEFIDKGKVYLVMHDFPLHEMALRATMLARCLPAERFFPVVDTLFKFQGSWLRGSETEAMAGLKQQVKFAGLTDAAIDSCLNDRGLEGAILANRLDAEQNLKIEATPTFIFNQKSSDRIVSAAPFDDFKKKIDSLSK